MAKIQSEMRRCRLVELARNKVVDDYNTSMTDVAKHASDDVVTVRDNDNGSVRQRGPTDLVRRLASLQPICSDLSQQYGKKLVMRRSVPVAA